MSGYKPQGSKLGQLQRRSVKRCHRDSKFKRRYFKQLISSICNDNFSGVARK